MALAAGNRCVQTAPCLGQLVVHHWFLSTGIWHLFHLSFGQCFSFLEFDHLAHIPCVTPKFAPTTVVASHLSIHLLIAITVKAGASWTRCTSLTATVWYSSLFTDVLFLLHCGISITLWLLCCLLLSRSPWVHFLAQSFCLVPCCWSWGFGLFYSGRWPWCLLNCD